MLLLSSPRSGHQRRASPLLLAAVLLCVVPAGAGLPAGGKCPLHIDCAKERRHFCKPGSSHCGPCLSVFEENDEGLCVVKKRHRQHGKVNFYPDLDEEIDYIIEKQEVSEKKTPKKQSKHPAAAPSQTDVQNTKTDATKHKQKSQILEETHSTTTTPRPTVSALPGTSTSQTLAAAGGVRVAPINVPESASDSTLVIMISVCVVVGTVAVILASVCYIKLQKESRLTQKVDYPAFRGAGVPPSAANGPSMGDKTLAQSAQMYHYQHQKQQMLSVGNHQPEPKALDTEVTSDEEEVGGDFTVYECPGLAPTGEMEVKNPLFDDSTIPYQGNK